MQGFEARGEWTLLGMAVQTLDAPGGKVQVETFYTRGQPYPMVHGKAGWPVEDPRPEDEYEMFMTIVVASLDEDGQPDLTIDRKVMTLNTLA